MTELLYFDNTRISTYRECPRKFFYRHYRDFTLEGSVAIDLAFGQAWHSAMNVVWGRGREDITSTALRDAAMVAFTQKWIEEGLPEPTALNFTSITEANDKKTPWTAMEMVENYIKQRRDFIRDCSEIDVERPFAVPTGILSPSGKEVHLIGRLDKVVKHKVQGRLVIEHKTTGSYAKEGGFRSDYIDSYSPNSQVDGYNFAGNSLYDGGIKGVWVDAALCHKTVHDKFKFIPCDRQFAMLQDWLDDTTNWVNQIYQQILNFEQGLPSFPKNTGACYNFSKPCGFRNICRFMADGQRLTAPPPGYKVERWEPFDVLEIGRIMSRLEDVT